MTPTKQAEVLAYDPDPNYSDAAKSQMLTALGAVAVFASLHTGPPGSTGASEVAGGTPAYARKPIVWGTPSAGSMSATTLPTFDVPASTTVEFMGLFSAVTAGTFYGAFSLGGGVPHPYEAIVAGNLFTSQAHGYVNGNEVVLTTTQGAVMPGGFAVETPYFIIGATTDTFQLSLTSGGAAITVTSEGAGFVQSIVPETFGSQGTYAVTSASLNLNA